MLKPDFYWQLLVAGDVVETPYATGVVVDKREERFVEFADGSGCSLHEVTAVLGHDRRP